MEFGLSHPQYGYLYVKHFMYTYDTMSEATNDLRRRGYTMDFNLQENCLICNQDRLDVDDFEITEVYRFEGISDPADSGVVYAVVGTNGQKGVLVTAYGMYAQGMGAEIARKLGYSESH